MTTKVTISVDATQQLGLAIITIHQGEIHEVHDVLPGQSGEFYVHSHQELHLHEIEPLAELPPDESPKLPDLGGEVAVVPHAGPDGILGEIVQVPAVAFINTVDSIAEATTTIQSGVIEPVCEEVDAILAEDIKDENGAVVALAGTPVTAPATETQTIAPEEVGSVHAVLDADPVFVPLNRPEFA